MYNNYNYGYGNYNPYQTSMQQQNYAYVNGIEGAKAYQMMPNQTALLMDSDRPVFYFKTSNAMGQSTIKAYKFEELVETPNQTQNAPEYALKSDLEALRKSIEEMKANG